MLLAVIVGGAVAWYGSTHGTLPGGKSMLVRWEYWVGAARDLCGTSIYRYRAGQFYVLLSHLQNPRCDRDGKRPAQFCAQYSYAVRPAWPCRIFGCLACTARIQRTGDRDKGPKTEDALRFRKVAISFLIFTVAVLLAIRPLVLQSEFGDSFMVMLVVIGVLYVATGGDLCGNVFVFVGK